MKTYRAFILDDADRIIRSEVLAVSNDNDALQASLPFADENDLEVWQGERRLARILRGGEIVLAASSVKP